MPRNYFLYNEKVGYNIHLDCTTLQIPVYKIIVSFRRTIKKNFSIDILKSRRSYDEKLFFKKYNLNKKEKIFNIIDYITCFNHPNNLKRCISPSEIYRQMDSHGLYEVDDQSIRSLYPSCSEGLIVVEYWLKIKVYFDTNFTSDEWIFAPVDFCDIIDYNRPNQEKIGNINLNKKINQIKFSNNFQSNMANNNININNNIINNNINVINNVNLINNINIIDDEAAPPNAQYLNIDGKKNFLEDNEKLDLNDWVIIDK